MHEFKAAIFLYQSLLEPKNFRETVRDTIALLNYKLKLSNLWHYQMYVRDEKLIRDYTVVIKNFLSGTSVYNSQTQLQNFRKK